MLLRGVIISCLLALQAPDVFSAPKDCKALVQSFAGFFDPWSTNIYRALGIRFETPRERAELQYRMALRLFQEALRSHELSPGIRSQYEEAVANIERAWGLYQQREIEEAPTWVEASDEDIDFSETFSLASGIRIRQYTNSLGLSIILLVESARDNRSIAERKAIVDMIKPLLDSSENLIAAYPYSTGASLKHFEVFPLFNYLRQQEFPFLGGSPPPAGGSGLRVHQNSSHFWIDLIDLGFRALPIVSLILPKALGATNEQAIAIAAATFFAAFIAFTSMRAFKFRDEDKVIEEARKGSWFDRLILWNRNRRLASHLRSLQRNDYNWTSSSPVTLIVTEFDASEIERRLERMGFKLSETGR